MVKIYYKEIHPLRSIKSKSMAKKAKFKSYYDNSIHMQTIFDCFYEILNCLYDGDSYGFTNTPSFEVEQYLYVHPRKSFAFRVILYVSTVVESKHRKYVQNTKPHVKNRLVFKIDSKTDVFNFFEIAQIYSFDNSFIKIPFIHNVKLLEDNELPFEFSDSDEIDCNNDKARFRKLKKNVRRELHVRNPVYGQKALKKASYLCEICPKHLSFLTRSGRNFVEAHHLIPMSKQESYMRDLNIPENIVALCPNCHRAIHHACNETRIYLVEKLFDMRIDVLKAKDLDITREQLMSCYF